MVQRPPGDLWKKRVENMDPKDLCYNNNNRSQNKWTKNTKTWISTTFRTYPLKIHQFKNYYCKSIWKNNPQYLKKKTCSPPTRTFLSSHLEILKFYWSFSPFLNISLMDFVGGKYRLAVSFKDIGFGSTAKVALVVSFKYKYNLAKL